MKKLSMDFLLIFGSLLAFICSVPFSYGQNLSLNKKWETPQHFKEPESVIYDSDHDMLYVSNINDPQGGKDGNGYISRISTNGKTEKLEWVVGGMDSPKGLGLSKGLLYVADLKKVVVIDIKTASVVKSIEVPDAGMLNDITVDKEGNIYVSDSDNKRIYILENDKPRVWLENIEFEKPNGLLALENKIIMIDMGSGILYEIDKKTKELREIANGLIGGDGIAPYDDGFFISNWNGEINFVSKGGEIKKLIDTKAEKINAADIVCIPQDKLLFVPTFYANKVMAYDIIDN